MLKCAFEASLISLPEMYNNNNNNVINIGQFAKNYLSAYFGLTHYDAWFKSLRSKLHAYKITIFIDGRDVSVMP